MSTVDYMKVLDLAAISLGSESHIKVDAVDIHKYLAVIQSPEGDDIKIDVKVKGYSIELALDKDVLAPKQMRKWLSEFEYRLEQSFKKNIVVDDSDNGREFRIKIDL